jgi:glycosyltransferase involved in cell wall biosynthesis
MAFGTPVVCSDAASLPEVVRDAAPIFAAGDADALASGLARVLDDGAVTEHLRTLAIMRIITLVIRATLQMGQSHHPRDREMRIAHRRAEIAHRFAGTATEDLARETSSRPGG